MPIEISKNVILKISGFQVVVMKNICEMARRHISSSKRYPEAHELAVDEYDTRQVCAMQELMDEIFDA